MSTPRAKVLVIDDELGPRESLRILLKTDYEVHCADCVPRGLELLAQQRPELVIMDIRMPGINGIEGLRELRQRDAEVSVVMLTGFGALETAQEALRLGASDYLKKPFDTTEMLAVVRRHVARTALNRRRAKMEQQIQELTSRISDSGPEQERLASLGEASAELVHDLRNPLTIIQGYVQMLGEEFHAAPGSRRDDESSADYLQAIEKSVRRCREIIDAWQDLSRKTLRDLAPIDPAQVVREAVESQRALAESGRCALMLTLGATPCRVLGDPVQLGRALQNIIGNAADALGDAGGSVRVELCQSGEDVVISVQDDGAGISEENLARLFQPYFTTKARGRGTGLGLFITRKIIEDHHGRIAIRSKPGAGTTVEIHLPAWSEVPVPA